MNPADANNTTPDQTAPNRNAVSPAGGFPQATQNQMLVPQFEQLPDAPVPVEPVIPPQPVMPQFVAPQPIAPQPIAPPQPVMPQYQPIIQPQVQPQVQQLPPPPQPQPQQIQQPQQVPPTVQVGAPQSAPVKPVKPVAKPNSTQNTLLIAEIRDGIVIMNDGSYRSVIMAKSINFDLMSQQEQEAVEYSYQGFLNSLYFPLQIFVRSSKVDLGPYIDKLDKIRTEHDNMLLALLMEDYINYIDNLSAQTNIMDKRFYIVIPYFPVADVQKALTQSKNFFSGLASLISPKEAHVVINEAELENAKTELRNRVQSVMSGLLQCGIQGLPLDTQELIELYYDTYNPDTATRQQLKNFDELSADVVTKGQGVASQAHLQRELQ